MENTPLFTGRGTGPRGGDGPREPLVGTGGWDYLNHEGDRLREYSRLFDFTEVNTTFYHVPRLSAARSWRRRVPPGFTFAVKCNRRATHELGLRPDEETFQVLEAMRTVMRALRSRMLVLQTPPSLPLNEDKVLEVGALLSCAGLGDSQVLWETRTPLSRGRLRSIRSEMLRVGITPVVDLGKEPPLEGSSVTYSRLFAPTRLTDEELRLIGSRLRLGGSEVLVLSFHGAAMYRDAHRFKEVSRL
jgi:uncharacterized protein YecE (DUF72 family)